MFSASAEFYDLIYSTFKDYAAEVEQITSVLRRLNPQCQTVLDVACGTGEHARRLAAQGFDVGGLDLNPAFVRIAEQKHPTAKFFVADMSDFHLPRRYDAGHVPVQFYRLSQNPQSSKPGVNVFS